MTPDFLSLSCQRRNHDALGQLGVGLVVVLELEVPVQHGQVVVLKLRDFFDVVDLSTVSGEQDDVSKKKDLDFVDSIAPILVFLVNRPGTYLESQLSMTLLNVQTGCPGRCKDLEKIETFSLFLLLKKIVAKTATHRLNFINVLPAAFGPVGEAGIG
jgi:hypothetical protein